jgi:hypothetical protein
MIINVNIKRTIGASILGTFWIGAIVCSWQVSAYQNHKIGFIAGYDEGIRDSAVLGHRMTASPLIDEIQAQLKKEEISINEWAK